MENSNEFGFGFNDVKFSDRTLVIELLPNPVEDPNVHEAVENNENPSSRENAATQTKTIHINTLILSGKSPFFYKLFSNGMAESNQRHVTLQIQESEEAAFINLLKFMYTNTLSSTTPSALLNVLMAADKYEVPSCIKYCIQLLQKLPMTCESAVIYLDLPSTIIMDDTIRPLIDAAKECLDARFTDLSKFEEEILDFPLARIEAVLSRDDLQVSSEDELYDFVMKWARRHYTKPDERREMLTTRLLRLIRLPFLSRSKLEEVVSDAISIETPHRELPPVKEQDRAYKLRPVKVIRSASPLREECVVYLELKRDECTSLLPNGTICSQPFDMGGHVFRLEGMHHYAEPSFGLFLRKQDKGSLRVEFQFASRWKTRNEEFVSTMFKQTSNFAEGTSFGFTNLFYTRWTKFIAEDNPYFINGVIYLRAKLKIEKHNKMPMYRFVGPL